MKFLKFFNNVNDALGNTETNKVFYLKGAPKPMFASKSKWGETCTIIIDDTEGNAGIKPAGITIIFRDDLGNIISKKEYKSGDTIVIPEAPVKAGYDFLGWGDIEIDKAVTNMTFIAQYEVIPKVTIIMNNSYTDGSSIALNATKTETVTGELSFTTDLASDIAHIEDNALIFDKHYEGSVTVTASALDKHSNIQSDSKTITVSCDVADTVECEITNVTAEDVEADATSATIKYDCNVTTTTHAGVSNTVVAHKEKTVTFEANESEEDVTRTGSFACEHGEIVEWSVVQKGVEVGNIPKSNQIWYKTNDGIVIVPSNMSPTTNTYDDKGVMTFADNVTSIAVYAFYNKPALTEFYVGKSLATVGSYAFSGCYSLTSIDLPNCTSVGYSAFQNCSSLTSIDLPKCTTVGDGAFRNCSSLTSINLPNCTWAGNSTFIGCPLTSIDLPKCTTVGYATFQNCSSLTSIDLPNCTTVCSYAFQNCSSLPSIDLPICKTISGQAFSNCTSLTSIDLPKCTSVGYAAFQNCLKLTSIDLPNCTSVGSYAFSNCTSLTSVNLLNCTSVGNQAFLYCSSLTSVNLLNCTSVGNQAFQYCSSLPSIDLPKCTKVGDGAFANCTSLSKFTGLLATEDNRCLMSNGTIYAFAPAGLTSYTREDCTSVGYAAFQNCSKLTSIDLPNCTSVGSYAFCGCSSLTKVTLGASTMCSLGKSNAFSNCTRLTSIYVTASLVDTYKANSVWKYYSSKIVPIA